MENRINKIVKLDNNEQYYILKQAVYGGDNYFVAAPVTEDEEDLKESFVFLHEGKEDGSVYIEFEENPEIIQILLKHLNLNN